MTSHSHVNRRRAARFDLRDPSRFGRYACYVAAFVLGYVVFPFLGTFGLGCLLLLLVPAIFGLGLGRCLAALREARRLRRLQRTPPGLRRLKVLQ